jgi:signal transduction histidine kinase
VPQHVTAAVTVAAGARCAWAIGATILVLAIPSVIASLAESADLSAANLPLVAVPFGALVVMLAAFGAVAHRPSPATLVGLLVVGVICVWAYQASLLTINPQLHVDSVFVLNRPALALVLVGTASASPLSAIGWGVAGYLAGQGAIVVVAAQLGLPPAFGAGPTLVLINYAAVFLGLALVHRTQRGRVPDLRRLQQETARQEQQRDRDRAEAALLHDTVLSDLALVLNAPDVIDDRVRARLLHDVATLSRGEKVDVGLRRQHPLNAEFRTTLTRIASDFQWRGLRVDVSIDPNATAELPAEVSAAALAAARACLENVLQHSGEDSAELVVGVTAVGDERSSDRGAAVAPVEQLTVMVVDAGVGFDPNAVPSDRLGLRASVVHRVESVGGSVRVWSAPGAGTSVLLAFPLASSEAAAGDRGAATDTDSAGTAVVDA